MKRLFFFSVCTLALLSGSLFAQDDGDLFTDDTVIDTTQEKTPADESAVKTEDSKPSADFAHGVLFQNGSVKVGGTYDMELTTLTTFGDGIDASDAFRDTLLTPKGDAQLTVDARPKDNLRMFLRTGIHFPYITEKNATTGRSVSIMFDATKAGYNLNNLSDADKTAIAENLFYVKELFTDFSLYDAAYFRFGKHTVTWGTGYFFSPASNIVNLTEIDPEKPTEAVEGPLSLRTQIVFKGTQNCLWAYLLPDTETYRAGDTAFALKGDIVLGGWELGLGGYYKYAYAPRAILTASGTLFNKVSVFGECVMAGDTDSAWKNDFSFNSKTPVWQATAGGSYTWKEPQITFAAQYYYDGNESNTVTNGNNVAATVSFAKVGRTDITALLYGNVNFDKKTAVASAMLKYLPINEITLGAGPYVTWSSFDSSPKVAVKVNAVLGGGGF